SGKTGRIIALITPDGQRTFCANLGVSEKCTQVRELAFKSSKIFFLTSITLACGKPVSKLAKKYLSLAKKYGKIVALSIESAPMVEKNRKPLLEAIGKYAEVLFMNEEEAEALLGENADRQLAKLKPEIPVYLKNGPHGSHLFLEGRKHRITALPANVIDTTGAGDAYAAGVLYGLSRKYSPLGSAKIGCMLATKVVQKLGAGIPHAHTRIRIVHGKKH
ncbi:MAG: PfkB family carbohydrate kinase, partial [Candidatus Anstonellaceae archaeon]